MAFKLVKCKGPHDLPLVEIPDGDFIFERLTPGTIREADFYDNFRKVKRKGKEILLACPKGKTRKGKCLPGQRLLRVRHPKKDLNRILKDCRSGKLSERRMKEIEKIVMDITGEELGQDTMFIGPIPAAKTTLGRIIQFGVISVVSTLISIAIIRAIFPDAFGGRS